MKIFKNNYILKNNIYNFNINDKTTEKVINFYNPNPFPNYKNKETIGSIINNGDNNIFIKQFKNKIGYNKNILEAGAGTAQLSNYLAIGSNNNLFAFDSTLKSLELGESFAKKNKIKNINFVKGNLLDEIFEKEIFDYIYCSGVLHHTKNPYLGFQQLAKYLKINGYIIIGLYNRYGRFRTFCRQKIYKYINKKFALMLDPYLRNINKNSRDKIKAWEYDQYRHPIESAHTYSEILKWFELNNIEFINCIPNIFGSNDSINFFKKTKKPNLSTGILEQIYMNFTKLGGEGGLFIFIGKKFK